MEAVDAIMHGAVHNVNQKMADLETRNNHLEDMHADDRAAIKHFKSYIIKLEAMLDEKRRDPDNLFISIQDAENNLFNDKYDRMKNKTSMYYELKGLFSGGSGCIERKGGIHGCEPHISYKIHRGINKYITLHFYGEISKGHFNVYKITSRGADKIINMVAY